MDTSKIVYTLVIVLLYIPLVFMGANVFFPKYDRFYHYPDTACSKPYLTPTVLSADPATNEAARITYDKEMQECYKQQQKEQEAYDKAKREYDAQKYIFITALNLVALLAAIFIPMDMSVIFGLFIGSTLATFSSTWIYFDTKSRIGFSILVLIFIASVYFINKARSAFFEKLGKKK